MTDPIGRNPLAGPPVLDFSGSRADGWPVSTPDGVVARMEVGWLTSEFSIRDPRGVLLCSGKVPFGAFGRRWEVVDAAGAPVLSLGVGWGRTSTVRFANGRECAVRGDFLSRAWEMTDTDGRIAARSVPTTSSWGFRPDAWLVQQDGSFTLTEFVAVVQTYRRVVQRRRAAAAAG